MIAFAIQAGREEDLRAFDRICMPALRQLAVEGADEIRIFQHPSSIHAAYEEARTWASGLQGLEALVLVHADAAVMSPWFHHIVRRAMQFHRGQIVAGVCGVQKAPTHLGWWEGEGLKGGVLMRAGATFHSFGDIVEVEAVDGVCLVLSPWAVRELRFDYGTYGDSWHAYDLDLARSCRAAGGKVVVIPLVVYHEVSGMRISDPVAFATANRNFQAKWKISS